MATIQITITNDDGSIADVSLTTMPQAVLDLAIASIASAYDYQETIPNPEYDSVDPTISPTIKNPMTPARHLVYQWRMFTTDHVAIYSQRQLEAAQNALQSSIAAMQSQVEVT